MKKLFLLLTHLTALAVGFAAGIYFLPILTAPPAPSDQEVTRASEAALFEGEFIKDLEGSDFVHWGEGKVSIGPDAISLMGEVSPGPDYKLYLSPEYVETEADFNRVKADSVRVGDVKTFRNFIIPVPDSVDPASYNTVVVWCESFGEFITAAKYR